MTELINPEIMQLLKQEEKLKITKNSKGYNWEYSLLGTLEEQLPRIDKIEKILISKFKMEVK